MGKRLIRAAEEAPEINPVGNVGNHIYFYSDTTPTACMDLMKTLHEQRYILENEKEICWIDFDIPIWLHVCSNGGDLFPAMAVADVIERLKTPVYTVVEGIVASAATFISCAGKKRYMLPNAFLLFHQLSSFVMGTHEDMKDELHLQEMATENMLKFYVEHSNLSEKELNEKLKRNFYINSEEAVKFGFVDAILDNFTT